VAQTVADKGRKEIEAKAKLLQRLQIEYVPCGQIHPNKYNPNRQSDHEYQLLRRSMEEEGCNQPITVDRESMQIIDGFHRWSCLRDLAADQGLDPELVEIPVVFLDGMDMADRMISTRRMNLARGTEDYDLTVALMHDLEQLGALDQAQEALMMSDIEVQRMLEEAQASADLAAKEFGEAWEPGPPDAGTRNDGREDVSMTDDAAKAIRRRDEAIQAAKTEQDREAAHQEADVIRIVALYAGRQGRVVKAVLGDHPADKLLQMCEEAYAQMSLEEPREAAESLEPQEAAEEAAQEPQEALEGEAEAQEVPQ
jgi:ParB-like nuclease domain